jgi:hypothetical protein
VAEAQADKSAMTMYQPKTKKGTGNLQLGNWKEDERKEERNCWKLAIFCE